MTWDQRRELLDRARQVGLLHRLATAFKARHHEDDRGAAERAKVEWRVVARAVEAAEAGQPIPGLKGGTVTAAEAKRRAEPRGR